MTATYQYIVDTGAINADTADVLTDVQNEFKNALGRNLNTAPSTPQGTLIATETIARTSVMKNNAEVANQINPNLSTGTFLDAICALLGIERGVDFSTTGNGVEFVGNSGVTIPQGSRVQTNTGEMFTVAANVTIGVSGKTLGMISSVNVGPISLDVQQLTIVDGVVGWGACNVTATTTVKLGALGLTDPQLKNARNLRLFQQGRSSIGAIRAALLAMDNVNSCMVIDNNTGAAGLVNGINFTLPNATWICVDGTADKNAIAKTIWESCQAAIPFDFGGSGNGVPVDSPNGTLVTDEASGLGYRVKFTAPILYDAYINITVSQGTSAADMQVAVANAIMNWAEGNVTGESGLTVGASLSSWEVSAAVNRDLPGVYVKFCEVARVPKGAAAPTSFSPEVVSKPYDLDVLTVGKIKVTVV